MSNSIVLQPGHRAKISGTVAYDGVVDGPAIVWALDENDTVVAQQTCPGMLVEIQVPKLTPMILRFSSMQRAMETHGSRPWKHISTDASLVV